jgi:hypothetical protein
MTMTILGIDPGAVKSGWVRWDERMGIRGAGEENNYIIRDLCKDAWRLCGLIAIERIRGYGIVAGDDTFDTCEWIGRFEEAAGVTPVTKIPRKDIKRHLCGNTTTNDKYVRQALIDRFGGQGTKKQPGPLYGISGHCWSALAVAVVAADRSNETRSEEEKDK